MGKKHHMSEKHFIKRLSDLSGHVSDIRPGVPLYTIQGRENMIVENFQDIQEYSQERIRISSKDCPIEISGENLEIITYSLHEIHVRGIINKIEYL